MSAYQKGINLINTYGYETIVPTLHGLTLGTATRGMSWFAHIPSVETVVIGVPTGSALLYGIYKGVYKDIGDKVFPYYHEFFRKMLF